MNGVVGDLTGLERCPECGWRLTMRAGYCDHCGWREVQPPQGEAPAPSVSDDLSDAEVDAVLWEWMASFDGPRSPTQMSAQLLARNRERMRGALRAGRAARAGIESAWEYGRPVEERVEVFGTLEAAQRVREIMGGQIVRRTKAVPAGDWEPCDPAATKSTKEGR